jgi:ribose-phosphate pyrophosphokinase
MAIIDKRRPKANVSEVMHVIGDIDGRNCVIMDDMIDTAGTLVKAAEVLKERGAKKVYAYCTHPIFSGPAIERIAQGDALDEVVITNTIPLSQSAQDCKKIRQLSVAPLIAETKSGCCARGVHGLHRAGSLLKQNGTGRGSFFIGVDYEIRRF